MTTSPSASENTSCFILAPCAFCPRSGIRAKLRSGETLASGAFSICDLSVHALSDGVDKKTYHTWAGCKGKSGNHRSDRCHRWHTLLLVDRFVSPIQPCRIISAATHLQSFRIETRLSFHQYDPSYIRRWLPLPRVEVRAFCLFPYRQFHQRTLGPPLVIVLDWD
jgi:hypothetical protein